MWRKHPWTMVARRARLHMLPVPSCVPELFCLLRLRQPPYALMLPAARCASLLRSSPRAGKATPVRRVRSKYAPTADSLRCCAAAGRMSISLCHTAAAPQLARASWAWYGPAAGDLEVLSRHASRPWPDGSRSITAMLGRQRLLVPSAHRVLAVVAWPSRRAPLRPGSAHRRGSDLLGVAQAHTAESGAPLDAPCDHLGGRGGGCRRGSDGCRPSICRAALLHHSKHAEASVVGVERHCPGRLGLRQRRLRRTARSRSCRRPGWLGPW
ncbi:hypothetical protein FA09DRAFT_160397 [Tilletiopsis washingtonensis]|uniref:Uncharacterized protein n=1 Tax=Tilletiopsis washingtonensis TaxID=58919 RepID=A0A316YZG4_9BASI|nr:hypothetical protein FA09DRAFT_160397 [Tilletiopsis washingtonensis]PWN94840.1 hypothetical protein FA09DRAFT_160397 [Tilletiopsis washingtonensis]